MKQFYLKIDLADCNAQAKSQFEELVSPYQKHVKQSKNSYYIISEALFNLIEYDIEYEKVFKDSKVSLILGDDSTGKLKLLKSQSKMGSKEYNELLRTLRF
jgi:hypothetical protein